MLNNQRIISTIESDIYIYICPIHSGVWGPNGSGEKMRITHPIETTVCYGSHGSFSSMVYHSYVK